MHPGRGSGRRGEGEGSAGGLHLAQGRLQHQVEGQRLVTQDVVVRLGHTMSEGSQNRSFFIFSDMHLQREIKPFIVLIHLVYPSTQKIVLKNSKRQVLQSNFLKNIFENNST